MDSTPPPPPPFRIFHAFKWETTDRLKSAFVAVDVSRLARYQGEYCDVRLSTIGVGS